eukprot:CAMPEP_0115150312 /NCGR_PEP_ID=MMETSP0227-20121206/64974_1 /TAXON_ID=89957 /ORGANISM="Polarella glacialis, Strain CCMP 1383" /LENGTH=626 /DNA_ID=CAMNT_0002560673 /DNA_START=63 /DNA_END=1943 /DNA_ORIENTATION=+
MPMVKRKVLTKKVAGGPAEKKVEAAEKKEDWLGEAEENEEDLGRGSGDEDDDDDEDQDDEGEEEEVADDDGVLGGMDDDAEAADQNHGSRILARIAEGTQPTDLNALKQQIQDDAALLTEWRKAKQMGDKRSREEVFKNLVQNCSTYFGYSEELAFLQMFSAEQAIKFFEANEQHRPLTIRTNSLKARRSSLMQALTQRKVSVDPVGTWTKVGLKVYSSQVPVGATPEYLGGHYMIQSASSFVPVMALAPQQDEVILDMAAAPGGKTTYIGQLMRNTGTLFANDLRRDRCKALVANVHRMGLTNVIVTNLDGKKLSDKLPKLDRVLLDAPCTGSGIISRDPSVKVKRGLKDFENHSALQKELLLCAIDMVDAGSKTGGYVVYSTCSVSVEENEAVIQHALNTRSVELVSFSSAVGFGVEGMTKYREKRFSPSMNLTRRYYPHVHNMDGFFVAKFKKLSNKVPERMKKDRTKGTDTIKVWGEEHWTPAMMDTVIDFEAKEASKSVGKKQKLNKIERKKLKRAETLKARGHVPTDAQVMEAGGTVEKPTKAKGKTGKLKLKAVKASAAAPASAAAAAPPASKPAASAAPPASKLIKKKRKAEAPVSGSASATESGAAKPAKKLKKKVR